MLKPSSTTIMDQDYVEYYPHVVFLHNKVGLQDFMPNIIDQMKVLCYTLYIKYTFLSFNSLFSISFTVLFLISSISLNLISFLKYFSLVYH